LSALPIVFSGLIFDAPSVMTMAIFSALGLSPLAAVNISVLAFSRASAVLVFFPSHDMLSTADLI